MLTHCIFHPLSNLQANGQNIMIEKNIKNKKEEDQNARGCFYKGKPNGSNRRKLYEKKEDFKKNLRYTK